MITQSSVYKSFKNKVLGAYIDYDKAWGSQCVDLAKLYCGFIGIYSVMGNAWQWADPDNLPTYATLSMSCDFIEKDFQQGDIIVFKKSKIMPYGHIALVHSVSKGIGTLLEQDGSTDKDNDGNADGVVKLTKWHLDSRVAGAWRLKADLPQRQYAEAIEKINNYKPVFPEAKPKPTPPISPPIAPPVPTPQPPVDEVVSIAHKHLIKHAEQVAVNKAVKYAVGKISDRRQRVAKSLLGVPAIAHALDWLFKEGEEKFEWLNVLDGVQMEVELLLMVGVGFVLVWLQGLVYKTFVKDNPNPNPALAWICSLWASKRQANNKAELVNANHEVDRLKN